MGQQSSRPAAGQSPDRPSRRTQTPRPLSALFRPGHDHSSRRATPSASSSTSSWNMQNAASHGEQDHAVSTASDHQQQPPLRRRSRLTRARESFVLPSILSRHTQSRPAASRAASSQRPSSQLSQNHPSPTVRPPALPPHQRMPALDIDFTSPSPPSRERSTSRQRRSSPHPRVSPGQHTNSRSQGVRPGNVADRISSLTPDRGFRSLVRRRRSPARNEDGAANLARMLAVAAAATAASLMGGSSEEAVQNLRNATSAIDGDDGTFDRFLQTLRSGRLAQRLGTASALDPANMNGQGNGMAFFRVFRFAQAQSQHQQAQGLRQTANSDTDSDGDTASFSGPAGGVANEIRESRMVPVLMIGIRSLPDTSPADGADAMPSFLDALTNFPAVNMNVSDQATPDEITTEAANQAATRHRRRASMGGLFTGSRDNNHRRSQASSADHTTHSRPLSEVGPPSTGSSTPLSPYPPPTTPSSRPLSALSSGASSPSRRASFSSNATATAGNTGSSSTLSNAALASRREHFRQTARTALESTAEEPQPLSPSSTNSSSPPSSPQPSRTRRLSESDFLRYGSGSARRNGVVEPDNSGGNRSWIIYVLGGSYPENHPILMAPSLFTDSPTYEDMMLLSSMLGPAKPPVATAEDVTRAGGLFRFELDERATDNGLIGRPVSLVSLDDFDIGKLQASTSRSDDDAIRVSLDERCQVCLCTYNAGEEARKLISCEHLFHRECIDQWLTTGRNSCPLCRRQGVEEKASSPAASSASTASRSQDAHSFAGMEATENEDVGRLFAAP